VLLGDLIDRGPTQMRVLEIARAMVESGDALCIQGNHEFNAIGYATPSRVNPGEFLRPNSAKNQRQHGDFLSQVGAGSKQHQAWTDWFKTLPLFLDLGGIRAVHGNWNDFAVAQVGRVYWDQSSGRMSDEFLYGCYAKGSELMAARKLLTCGVEWDLPDGMFINGKGGEQHKEVRIANWRHWAKRLPEVALVPEGNEDRVPDIPIPSHLPMEAVKGSPIFIGHHWFDGHPAIESPKLACLDWSAA